MTDSNPPASESPWALITRRAIEDPDFRERLIDDPRSTITEATGQEVPEDIEIVVVENSPKSFHIVLPNSDLDLADIDVAGGFFCGPWHLTGTCADAPLC
ncbi:MAG TPA: NHLP leader peptide family RiPP precursor [Candidatus Nanopelagicales bacterium]|nr:NHLP leader peptide family RiPP precursor [Candidatus Nanopelagicales bacterium]